MKSMTAGKPLKLILMFALPLLLGNLLQQLYNIADAAIVGNILGGDKLAAVGASGGVQFLVLGFCIGLCSGFTIPVANSFGAKNYREMRKYISGSVFLSIVSSAVITTVAALLVPSILKWLSVPGEIYDDAYTYLLILFLGVPFTILYNIGAAFLRAVGDSKTPFTFLAISTVLNIVLDYLFVAVFGFGCAGAAVATVLSQALSGFLCFAYIKFKTPLFEFREGEHKLEAHRLLHLLAMGVPMGLQFSFTALGIVFMQAANNTLGTVYITALTASIRIKQFLLCPFDALGVATATYIAQNDGAGEYSRIKKGSACSLAVGLIYSLIAGAILVFFGGRLTGLFVSGNDSEVILYSGQYLGSIGMFFWLLPLLIVSRNGLQGLGRSFLAVFAGVVEMIARAVVCFVFVPVYGFAAICVADQCAWAAGTLYILPLFIFFTLKSKKSAETDKNSIE